MDRFSMSTFLDIRTKSATVGKMWLLASLAGGPAVAASTDPSSARIVRGDIVEISLGMGGAREPSVHIDGVYANAFAKFKDGKVSIRLPFPERRKPVTIVIVDPATGETLHEEIVRRVSRLRVWDTVEHDVNGQLDAVMTQASSRSPDNDKQRRSDGAVTSRFAATLGAKRGAFSLTAGVEAVGVTDEGDRLRNPGSAGDIARGSVTAAVRTAFGDFSLQAGDIALTDPNELVSGGITSRGIIFGGEAAGGRVRFRTARTFGTDIIGVVHGPIGWSTRSRRTAASVEADVLREGPVKVSLNASYLSAKRPAETNFNIGETPNAEINTVTGVGAKVAAFDDRLRISALNAWSRYDNPLDDGALGAFAEDAFVAGETRGDARRILFEWDAWSGEWKNRPASIRFNFSDNRASPLYRTVQGFVEADRRTREAGADISVGSIGFRFSHADAVNNLDDVPGILKTGEDKTLAAFDIALLDRYDDNTDRTGPKRLLPDTLSGEWRRDGVKTLNGAEVGEFSSLDGSELPLQVAHTANIRASWRTGWGEISTDYTYAVVDNKQTGRELADRTDHRFGTNIAVEKKRWGVTGRVAVVATNEKDPAAPRRDRGLEYGATIRTAPPGVPEIQFGYDHSQQTQTDLLAFDASTSETDNWFASAEFGPWLGEQLSLKTPPSLTLRWQRLSSNTRNPFFQNRLSDESFTLTFGRSF